MSRSRFMILLGTGTAYDGEGLAPDALLSFYDDKGVWVFQRIGSTSPIPGHVRWATTPDNLFEDALLMTTVYLLATVLPDNRPISELLEVARKSFKLDVYAPEGEIIDTGNQEHIAAKALQELHRMNRKALSETNVKIVAIRLAPVIMHIGGTQINDSFIRRFTETVESYGIKNVELCQSTYTRSWGAFDESEGEPPNPD